VAREGFALPGALRERIVAHARESAPNEACGLLAGKDGVPGRAIRCANVDETPMTRYRPDPRDLIRAFREMDDRGEDLVAIYHSHPASPAYPSPTDRAESADERGEPRYPGAVYVLVSVRTDEPEIRAFRIKDDIVTELVLG